MASSPDDVTTALTAGVANPAGTFRYEVATDRWTWSDEVYRMHGFEPGEIVPTTAMILAHKHPDDRDRYAGALTAATLVGGTFASVHRILDAQGEQRVLATIGEAKPSRDGVPVAEIVGHVIDVTASVRALAADDATRQIRAADGRRAAIDRATGMIAARSGSTIEEASQVLRRASRHSNVGLRTLAEWVVADARHRHGRLVDGEAWLRELGRRVQLPRQAGPDDADDR